MKKTSFKQIVVLTATLMLVLFAFSGSEAQAQTRTVKLGTLEPLTGPAAAYGIPAKEGAMMAVDEINEAGGLKIGNERVKIELVISDTRGKGNEAVAIVEKYIERDGIKIILGDLITSSAWAWAPVIERYNGKVLAVMHPSDPKIATIHPHIFSTKLPVAEYFEGTARFLFQNLKLKKMAMLIASDDYGVMVAKGIKKEFEKQGGKVVMEKNYNFADTDYYTPLTAVKGIDHDCLFVAGILPSAHFIFKQAKELGIKSTMGVIAAAGEKDSLKKFKCQDLEGTYDFGCGGDVLMRMGREATIRIGNNYKKRYGKEITGLAVLAYETMRITAAGLEKAGSVDDLPKIMDGLYKLTVNDINHVMFNTRKAAPGTTDKVFSKDRVSYHGVPASKWQNCQVQFVDWIR